MLGMPPRLNKKKNRNHAVSLHAQHVQVKTMRVKKAASRNVVAESTGSCLAYILKSMLQVAKLNNAIRQIQ